MSLYLRSAMRWRGRQSLPLEQEGESCSRLPILIGRARHLVRIFRIVPYHVTICSQTGRDVSSASALPAREPVLPILSLTADNAVKGVATVKVNLSAFEQEWRRNGDNAIVLDEPASSSRLRATTGATARCGPQSNRGRPDRHRASIGDANLSSLDWRIVGSSQDETQRIETPDGGSFVIGETSINDGLWRPMVLSDSSRRGPPGAGLRRHFGTCGAGLSFSAPLCHCSAGARSLRSLRARRL